MLFRSLTLPTSTAWLLTDIAEAKGKQELYTRQSPQILKALRDTAIIQSAESSNRIEGVTVDRDRLRPLVLGHTKPRDVNPVAADVSPLHPIISGESQSRLTSAATVQESKEDYYEALQRSSQRWHEGEHDLTPWLNFFLAIIRRACAEFEQRAGQIKSPRGAKTALVLDAIQRQPEIGRASCRERV